ncbi:MAG: hypothetical protein ACN2B6_06505 [Rickettsiales bacterium]
MRLSLFVCLIALAGCTKEQAKQDRLAVEQQLNEDGQYVAEQTEANAELIGDNVEKHAKRIADNVRDQVKKTNRKVRDWWLTPMPEKHDTPIANSYCYKALQDVLCYRQPVPGWEHRLAGYQGTYAKTPPAVQTEPLPTINMDGREHVANRIAAAKPVFKETPKEEEVKPETTEEILNADPANEVLPNPMLSPQL